MRGSCTTGDMRIGIDSILLFIHSLVFLMFSKYTLEVIDSENPKDPLASFALHNSPIHHPEGRDVALMHIEDEDTGEMTLSPSIHTL